MEPLYTTRGARLGAFGTEYGGEIDLYGNWLPGKTPEHAAAVLMQVTNYLYNVEAPLEMARQIAMADTAKRFETETDPDDEPWAALSGKAEGEGYWHWKVELEGYPDEILTMTELLKDTAPSGWMVVGPNLVYDPHALPRNKKGVNYGAILQAGESNVKTQKVIKFVKGKGFVPTGEEEIISGLPARPFIGLSEEAVAKIEMAFAEWFAAMPVPEFEDAVIGGVEMGQNVLGEFPAVGGFYRAGGYQPLLRLPSGRVSFGRMVRF